MTNCQMNCDASHDSSWTALVMPCPLIYATLLFIGLSLGAFLPYFIYRKDLDEASNLTVSGLPEMGVCESSNQTKVLTVGEQLKKQLRIFCWVMTMPENHHTKAKAIWNGWGRKCNKILFVTTKSDQALPYIVLPDIEGRDILRKKAMVAFKHIHKYYLQDADWFLKADDDTFVIMENLRYFLLPYNQSRPLYFGLKMTTTNPNATFMYGGAGYVLNKEAIKLLVEVGFPDQKICFSPDATKNEDMFIGQCMKMLGVDIPDTYDDFGRERFLHNTPEYVIREMDGLECCSDFAVSFHYIDPDLMDVLSYFLYKFKLLGVVYDTEIVDRIAYRLDHPYLDNVGQCEARNSVGCKTRLKEVFVNKG